MVDLITRDEWGALPTELNPVRDCPPDGTVLHHMVGLYAGFAGQRELQRFHMLRRGWLDTGYHDTIDVEAYAWFEHRGKCVVGAHARGWNHRNGIGVGGNFDVRQPTDELVTLLAATLRAKAEAGWIKEPKFVGAHRDVRSTSCPGRNLYPLLGDINQLAAAGPVTPPAPAPAPTRPSRQPEPGETVIADLGLVSADHGNRTSRRLTQGLLAAFDVQGRFAPRNTFRQLSDRRTRPDGIWGSGSDGACRSFQEARGLLVDGIVGPATFTALADGAFARLVSTRHSPRTHAAGVAQMLLAARGYPPERSFRFLSHGRAVPDRNVGRLTDQAIRAFQRSRGIGVDGIVGPQTWGRLVA